MGNATGHYYPNGFPKALTHATFAITAALFMFFFSLTTTGAGAFIAQVAAAALSIYVLMSFRLSVVPRDVDRVERWAMWGLYCYILTMAFGVILGVVILSW
jgi:hypothetical protein